MPERSIELVHDDLVRAGALAPVALSGPEERTWLDCDLASLAENRLGEVVDPRDLNAARRAHLQSRATDESTTSLRARNELERCYWILNEGRRAGTLALAKSSVGMRSVRLSSFYVLPSERGKGMGRRAMATVQEALANRDLGLRLDTSWCWQRAVRFYMKLGLWVYMWKRELTFCWEAQTPPPRIEVGEQTASLSVPLGDSLAMLARAHRRGDVLHFEGPPRELDAEKRIGSAYWHASSTLSLAVALRGWPLIRSPEEWDRCYYADAGPPEALARRITLWEAWAVKHDWLVSAPRIPGLEYPTWDEFEAQCQQ